MDYFSTNNSNSTGSSSFTKAGKKRKGGSRSKGGVKLSTDPQSVAARERRHRISDRFKILQSLVPGGTKMDTVSMLDEAIHYVKYLKAQIWLHQNIMNSVEDDPSMLVQGSVPLQEGFYSNITNFTAQVQEPSMVQPSPPLALQEFNCFEGEETINYLNDYMKYYLLNSPLSLSR